MQNQNRSALNDGLSSTRQSYAAIDLCKFFSSICVIMIHCPPLLSFGNQANIWFFIVRIAVPFFFLSSAYFLFSKINRTETLSGKRKVLWNYVVRLVKLWLFWSFVYLVIRLVPAVIQHKPLLWEAKLILRDFVFSGISNHLWFLPSLIFACLCVYFLEQHWDSRVILSVAAVLFVIGLFDNTYAFVLPQSVQPLLLKLNALFCGTRNGLFFGLIYVAIGSYLSRKGQFKIKQAVLLGGIAGSLLLLLAEHLFVYPRTETYTSLDMWIFAVPATVFLFIWLTRLNLRNTPLTFRLREMSLLIYLIHPAFITGLGALLPLLGFGTLYESSLLYFTLTLLLSVLTAWAIASLKNQKRSGDNPSRG